MLDDQVEFGIAGAAGAGSGMPRHFLDVNGRQLSYFSAGETFGPPALVLIHGSGVSAAYWGPQLQRLGEAHRVLAIDLPGHGESEPIGAVTIEDYAEVVATALDRLGTGPVMIAGHSLGGCVAIALAARRPDAVAGLVVLSSCARIPYPGVSGERLFLVLPGPLRKLVFFSLAKKILFAPGAPAWAVELGMREIQACRPETLVTDVRAAKAMDLTERAAKLEVPTLVLVGSRDRLTPPALSERLHELIPGSRLTVIEGAGHMLLLEVPERVNQEIEGFLGSIGALSETVPVAPPGHPRLGRFRSLWAKLRSALQARVEAPRR